MFEPGNPTRYLPGKPGGPGRPPRTRCITDAIRAACEANDSAGLKAIAKTIMDKAIEGESWACQMVADRLEGKVTDRLDVTSGDQSLDRITVTFVDAADVRRQKIEAQNTPDGDAGPNRGPVTVSPV